MLPLLLPHDPIQLFLLVSYLLPLRTIFEVLHLAFNLSQGLFIDTRPEFDEGLLWLVLGERGLVI